MFHKTTGGAPAGVGLGAVARLFPLWNPGLPLLRITLPMYIITLTVHTNPYTQ